MGTATRPYPHPQFRLAPTHQRYHGLVWGSTGTGKSKLLESIFLQHVNKGHGVCLIDPHADLSLSCLAQLASRGFFRAPDAFERLVYVDFGEGHIPFNVLATGYDAHTTALNALEALTRTWKDLTNAPLFKTLFLSSALVLIANDLPLTEINALLLDREFRARCLARATDPLIRQTFAFYDRHGQGQAGSTLRRAFLLSFSPITRGVLGQKENRLDFRAMMDAGTSLIVNLGSIADPVTRRLVGCLIMVQIEQAALSRTNLPPEARRPWTCLVDEWPSFAAAQPETIENVLSQTRKFNLRLYLVAQALSQVESARLSGALENCHLSVTFRLGVDSARIQAKHIADIDPYRVKQAASKPGGRDQYMSTSEQLEEWVQAIAGLPPRQALVKLHGQKPVRITTLSVPRPEVADAEREAILAEYRRRYQRRPQERGASPLTLVKGGFDILSSDEYDHGSDTITNFEEFFGEPLEGDPTA